jgi:hypothetical protein
MAKNELDSGQNQGNAAMPNAAVSDDRGDQQGSGGAEKLLASFDTLTKRLDEIDARTRSLQGDKDRGVKKVSDEISDLKKMLADYDKLREKLSPDEAIEQIELKQSVQEIRDFITQQRGTSASTQAPGTGDGVAVNAAKAFAEFDLDLKDPRVADALGKTYNTEAEAVAAAGRVYRQIQLSPTPTPAQDASVQGSVVHQNTETLKREYIQKVTAARGNKSLIKALQEQYRNLGVDVGNIGFNV